MTDRLDLSIIMPAYNRAHLITRALDSVARQQVLPREIVVVDDGSADQTSAVVAAWAETSPVPVNLITSPLNRGVGATRNIAMREAKGELLAMLDSDDEYLPGALARLAQPLMDHKEAVVSFGDAVVRFEDGSPEFRHVQRNLVPDEGASRLPGAEGLFRLNDPQRELLTTSYVPPSASIFRREAAIRVGLMPEKRFGEDWLFFLRLTGEGDFLCQFTDCAIIHRQDDNLTDSANDYPNALRTLESLIELREGTHVAIAERHQTRLAHAIEAQAQELRYFASRKGLSEYWRALADHPTSIIASRAGHVATDPRSLARALYFSFRPAH